VDVFGINNDGVHGLADGKGKRSVWSLGLKDVSLYSAILR
jgi:hypothetical protein